MTPPIQQPILAQEEITVKINGMEYKVPSTFSEVSLNDYLRSHLKLTGTKVMCREGGCGACIVHVAYRDPSGSGQIVQHSVNSCLCPILSCDGWEITTVEGVGSRVKPHAIQTKLVEHYGTQCGYCTPGMVMSMYSLMQTTPPNELTRQQIEDWFGGNICRCTGYRPILQAFKSFAVDADSNSKCNLTDLEDIGRILCKTTGKVCEGKCHHAKTLQYVKPLPQSVAEHAPAWFNPASMSELYQLVDEHKDLKPYYVVGHTGIGVYNDGPYQVYINLRNVPELNALKTTSTSVSIGANVSLTNVINTFTQQANSVPTFGYMKGLAELLKKTASPALRNAGSWGGNLAMKNRHKDMPSDSFVGFAAADARIFVGQNGQPEKGLTMDQFLKEDMKGKVIVRIEFPPKTASTRYRTFKIMPRSQNSHSYVHAAFIMDVDTNTPNKFIVKGRPGISFGNISSTFVRATKTEDYLINKDIADQLVLQQALKILQDELVPEESPTEAAPSTKKSLAMGLFYKFALEVSNNTISPRYLSAVGPLPRAISTGTQKFETKRENFPLTQPVPKLESMIQATGEAKYPSDIEKDGMLHAAFAVANRGNAMIYQIGVAEAMAVPGVVKVLTVPDIPGDSDISINYFGGRGAEPEPLLTMTEARYAGQPVAIVVAETRDIAEKAAKLVEVQYTNEGPVLTSAKQAIQAKSFFKEIPAVTRGDAAGAITRSAMKISGEVTMGLQFHYHMETQAAVAWPTEEGVSLESSTQWLDFTQDVVCRVLGLPANAVSVSVKRVGGGFGAKIMRSGAVAAAAALAAHATKRPVKMHMSLWDNMKTIGKRFPYYVRYQAGFDRQGKISGVIFEVYSSVGAYSDQGVMLLLSFFIDNIYFCPAWKVSMTPCKVHTPNNTACRSPASLEGIFLIETVFEHIASVLGRSSIDIKRMNFMQNGDTLINGSPLTDCTISPIVDQLLKSSDHQTRLAAIKDFNKANRWRKKGISVVPMRFPCHYAMSKFSCHLVIFHNGGRVLVAHGGVEIGQGINTKVAQVVAYELGIDLDFVKVETTSTTLSPNNFPTGGSVTSELCCLAAIDACQQMKKRLEPVRAKMPTAQWSELIEAVFMQGIDLSARGWTSFPFSALQEYNTFGVMCAEVELDTLTGEYNTTRIDVLYDCGEAMNPIVDMGQVEGAIVMGIGYFTSEEIVYDPKTGENLTNSTWTYKPPTTKDIPVDMRITLLPNAPNPHGVLRSKIVAEPPLCMSCAVLFALRNAIVAVRIENGKGGDWFNIEAPFTPARVLEYCSADIANMKYRD